MFQKAIDELNNSGELVSSPTSFQKYILDQGISAPQTAQHIAVNTFSALSRELKDAECMIFRLGIPKRLTNTEFAIAKCINGWSDYFFLDNELFSELEVSDFNPETKSKHLLSFKLFPNLTETSMVNLALASGLLLDSLNISEKNFSPIPATGKSVFTFEFQPTSHSTKRLMHNKGQIEVDALFVGERNGRDCIFVLEAKDGSRFDPLAKHKLFYPVMAIQSSVPKGMEIVPVYMRTIRKPDNIEFNILECTNLRAGKHMMAIDQFSPLRVDRRSLRDFGKLRP